MYLNASDWYGAVLAAILGQGQHVAPRGQRVKECLGVALYIDDAATRNIVVNSVRKLNYRFLIAEWLWIAFGRRDLSVLTPYNPRMAQFSDDGQTLAGAYGPRLAGQWAYIIETLRRDPDSRQAVATIWTPSPAPSRDIPCTVSLQFLLRRGRLITVAAMRSSDAWLGLPYDVFTFSQLGNSLAGLLGASPGPLLLHLASSHLYEEHWDLAEHAWAASTRYAASPALPGFPPPDLETVLEQSVRSNPLVRLDLEEVWHRYARALRCKTSTEALAHLDESRWARRPAA